MSEFAVDQSEEVVPGHYIEPLNDQVDRGIDAWNYHKAQMEKMKDTTLLLKGSQFEMLSTDNIGEMTDLTPEQQAARVELPFRDLATCYEAHLDLNLGSAVYIDHGASLDRRPPETDPDVLTRHAAHFMSAFTSNRYRSLFIKELLLEERNGVMGGIVVRLIFEDADRADQFRQVVGLEEATKETASA